MSTVLSILLDSAVLLHVLQFVHQHDVVAAGIIDSVISDARYRPSWLELLR
jgi:hypothetical protein